jgi:two-component system sensor kinase
MSDLVEDLLQLSQLSREIPHRETVDMSVLVDKVVDRYHDEIDRRGVEVDIGSLPTCTGDPHLLEQVWANLFDNALKFTCPTEKARIWLGGEVVGDSVSYTVEDNGVGFDARYTEKLFEVFQRLHPPDEFEGTGIGLAIVERIVEAHGGAVRAECHPGASTRFSFTIPRWDAEGG